jgi:hypothetical protein
MCLGLVMNQEGLILSIGEELERSKYLEEQLYI